MKTEIPRTGSPAVSKKPVAGTWIGTSFILLTLTLGAAQLEGSRRMAMAASSQQESAVSVGEFEYFPAQYVSRANALDDPIQAF